ncbi:MAG: HemK2/MTQ2 family protein methyltransferase [Nanoarchaeota archaeon]
MVYDPAEDTLLLAKQVKLHAQGTVLDMGSGSGALADAALANTAVEMVLCVDHTQNVVSHLKQHFAGNTKVSVVLSSLFSKISKQFDVIVFNPPYLPQDVGIIDDEIYGGKHGYEVILEFLRKAPRHLLPGGRILMLWSSLSHPDIILDYVKKQLLEPELLDSVHLAFEDLFVYQIVKSSLRVAVESVGVSDLEYFKKGTRGMIFTGFWREKNVAVKLTNPASKAFGRLEIEAEWLRKVNKKGIGPRFLASGDGYVISEFIDGVFISDFLEHATTVQVRQVLKMLLDQCRILDKLGVDKEEMHHPYKHVFVTKNPLKVQLLDFERAHATPSPKNVTQCSQFILGPLASVLAKHGMVVDIVRIRELARNYKISQTTKDYNLLKDGILYGDRVSKAGVSALLNGS